MGGSSGGSGEVHARERGRGEGEGSGRWGVRTREHPSCRPNGASHVRRAHVQAPIAHGRLQAEAQRRPVPRREALAELERLALSQEGELAQVASPAEEIGALAGAVGGDACGAPVDPAHLRDANAG